MAISTSAQQASTISYEFINWVATDPLPRDREQSHRLHEPDHLINSIDPVTGRDLGDVQGHPSLMDGNLTIYFESESSRKAFQNMPLNHPYGRLPNPPSVDDDRGG